MGPRLILRPNFVETAIETLYETKSFQSVTCISLENNVCTARTIRVTRQSKQCGFRIYIFDNSKSKSMVRLVRAEKMVLAGLVFARKIARVILIQNI